MKEYECAKYEKVYLVSEIYYKDYFDGFGSASYCKDCIVKGIKLGFDDPNVIYNCGVKIAFSVMIKR